MEQTLYGVTSYDKGGNAGFVVHCLFTTREAADEYAAVDPKEYEVEEYSLYDEAPKPYTYWHRGANVYPDGTVDDWTKAHEAQPPGYMEPVDDHLEPWDGHTQGHCGLHISIFGTDRDAVETAYQRHLATALAQSDGTCHSLRLARDSDASVRDRPLVECGLTGPFQTNWSTPVRSSSGE